MTTTLTEVNIHARARVFLPTRVQGDPSDGYLGFVATTACRTPRTRWRQRPLAGRGAHPMPRYWSRGSDSALAETNAERDIYFSDYQRRGQQMSDTA